MYKWRPPLITCCWRWSCAESSPAPDTCRTFELIYDDKISTEGKTAPVLNSASGASFRTFLSAFRFLALTTSGVLMSSFWMIETPMAVAKLLHPSRFSKLIVTIWVTGVYRWSPTEPPPAQQRDHLLMDILYRTSHRSSAPPSPVQMLSSANICLLK